VRGSDAGSGGYRRRTQDATDGDGALPAGAAVRALRSGAVTKTLASVARGGGRRHTTATAGSVAALAGQLAGSPAKTRRAAVPCASLLLPHATNDIGAAQAVCLEPVPRGLLAFALAVVYRCCWVLQRTGGAGRRSGHLWLFFLYRF